MIKFAVAAAAVLVLGAIPPGTALAGTDAEAMRCRAIGETMVMIGISEKEAITLAREGMTNPTAEDQETLNALAELEMLTDSTIRVGEMLIEIYADAPTPTDALMDELLKADIDALLDQVEKCG
ncbi:hypothetical protein [Asticcacaulis sp. AC402]|uniref:hypothetical protein n=1 Tax=Asticcacaulis sp. AC402 TaxID=1282361 RepID=UPI000423AC7E|nr:hypothetical protein [Asticcacaulis sp. AC402]